MIVWWGQHAKWHSQHVAPCAWHIMPAASFQIIAIFENYSNCFQFLMGQKKYIKITFLKSCLTKIGLYMIEPSKFILCVVLITRQEQYFLWDINDTLMALLAIYNLRASGLLGKKCCQDTWQTLLSGSGYLSKSENIIKQHNSYPAPLVGMRKNG